MSMTATLSVRVQKIVETIKKNMALVLLILVILVAAGLGYVYTRYTALTQDQSAVNQKKIAAVVEKVDKLIALHKDETPTLATVSNTTALGEQPFFKNARVGDQVLLYAVARKAYLYSPERNMLIEVVTLKTGE